MKLLLENIADIQEIYGTRIIYNNVSCIKNIIDKDMFNKCLIYSETKNQKIKDHIKWNPMDADWKSRCKESMFWFQDTLEDMNQVNVMQIHVTYGNKTKMPHASVPDMRYLTMECGVSIVGLYGTKPVPIRLLRQL